MTRPFSPQSWFLVQTLLLSVSVQSPCASSCMHRMVLECPLQHAVGTGLTPWCEKAFSSLSRFLVQSVCIIFYFLRFVQYLCVITGINTYSHLKIPSTGNHMIVWMFKNTSDAMSTLKDGTWLPKWKSHAVHFFQNRCTYHLHRKKKKIFF